MNEGGLSTHRPALAWSGIAAILAVIGGCTADSPESNDADFSTERIVELAEGDGCVDLIAGKRAHAGTVCTTIDNTIDTSDACGSGATGVLNVTFETEGPWELVKARTGVGRGLEDIPTTRRGRVKKNHLPLQSGDITGATEHTFTVPLCQLGLDGADEVCDPVNAHFVAHARVRKQRNNGTYRYKGAWGDGERLGRRRRWGRFYTQELTCSENQPPPANCETAFAAGPGAQCFLGADFDGDGNDDGFANWGFTNGGVSPGTSTQWPVYAAVGGCEPSQGRHVGNLGVSYDGETATLTFDRVGGVLLDEEQIYIGSEALPRDAEGQFTATPADFPIAVDLDQAESSTHTISGLSGDLHLVYHGVVCGEGLDPDPDPLAVLTDEFLVDGDPIGWTQHNPQDADVGVSDGGLNIQPRPNAGWYDTNEALHVYKTVAGNFAVTTQIQVTDLVGGPVAPGAPYRVGGIMVRDPASALPNSYHLGIGNLNEPGVSMVSSSLDDGATYLGTQPWDASTAELRICRIGADVLAFIRMEDEPWTQVDGIVRTDLPDTLAVGPIGFAGLDVADLHVESDWVQFETVHKVADCFRD